MSRFLVIVESPTKERTISHILGGEYEVSSSMGHVMDLPARSLSVNIKKGFKPTYKVIPGKEKTVSNLRKKAKDKDVIYLATDPDREGEAIGWHIKNILSKNGSKKFYRVVFHEITESAIKDAFKEPGDLDLNKVNAQKVRRILDRIVGYFLSPFLWKKISRGLSAGRVQSVALRFIVEREKEIEKFVPKTTYEIEGLFRIGNETFKARLKDFHNKKAVFETKEEAEKAIAEIKNGKFFVKEITKREVLRRPPPPLTTSLLQ
ncbi:MAG: DNA topoisomerase, partial [Candidatus Omnitrophica bacterium]|nr:DNA topoisomerase [Candidatus Omnitrophota bacterium]